MLAIPHIFSHVTFTFKVPCNISALINPLLIINFKIISSFLGDNIYSATAYFGHVSRGHRESGEAQKAKNHRITKVGKDL